MQSLKGLSLTLSQLTQHLLARSLQKCPYFVLQASFGSGGSILSTSPFKPLQGAALTKAT